MAKRESDSAAEQSPVVLVRRLLGLRGGLARDFYDQATIYARSASRQELFTRAMIDLAKRGQPLTVETIRKAISDLELGLATPPERQATGPLRQIATDLGADTKAALAFIEQVQEHMNRSIQADQSVLAETPETATAEPAERGEFWAQAAGREISAPRLSHGVVAEVVEQIQQQGQAVTAEAVAEAIRSSAWFAHRQEILAVSQARSQEIEADRVRIREETDARREEDWLAGQRASAESRAELPRGVKRTGRPDWPRSERPEDERGFAHGRGPESDRFPARPGYKPAASGGSRPDGRPADRDRNPRSDRPQPSRSADRPRYRPEDRDRYSQSDRPDRPGRDADRTQPDRSSGRPRNQPGADAKPRSDQPDRSDRPGRGADRPQPGRSSAERGRYPQSAPRDRPGRGADRPQSGYSADRPRYRPGADANARPDRRPADRDPYPRSDRPDRPGRGADRPEPSRSSDRPRYRPDRPGPGPDRPRPGRSSTERGRYPRPDRSDRPARGVDRPEPGRSSDRPRYRPDADANARPGRQAGERNRYSRPDRFERPGQGSERSDRPPTRRTPGSRSRSGPGRPQSGQRTEARGPGSGPGRPPGRPERGATNRPPRAKGGSGSPAAGRPDTGRSRRPPSGSASNRPPGRRPAPGARPRPQSNRWPVDDADRAQNPRRKRKPGPEDEWEK